MTNTLQIFEHSKFGSIRTMFDENGKVIFCGKDIAKALGYSDTVNALKQHCCGVVKHHLIDSLGRQQEATFIPESDVYRLIISSKLPSAEKFERWVFEEVLPTLMHEGSYSMNKTESSPFKLPSNYLEALEDLVETEKKRLMLEAKIEQDAPYTALGHALTPDQTETSIGMMATILSQTTGRKISSITLFEMLRRDNFLCSTETEKNRPRQKWVDQGIFKYRTYPAPTSRGVVHKFTPYLTPKGRAYIENKYGKKEN